jgi:hypothetical protein
MPTEADTCRKLAVRKPRPASSYNEPHSTATQRWFPEVIENGWQNADRDYLLKGFAKRRLRIDKDMSAEDSTINPGNN